MENRHVHDVIFTENSLKAFIGKIRNNIKDNYHFVSTSDMAERGINNNDLYEKEIVDKFPNWDTEYPAKICIINNEIPIVDNNLNNGRYTWIRGGSLLNFEEELSEYTKETKENRPCGTIYIDENNGTKIHVIKVKGFDGNGNFYNSTPITPGDPGGSGWIATDSLYVYNNLGTIDHPVPDAYIKNLHISQPISSDLIVTSTTDAKRYTSGQNGDPATGTEINNIDLLEGSIKTLGGIAAGKTIKGYKVHGAVFNDYAEYRHTEQIQPGRCVIETGKGDLILSDKRMQLGANIVSDTYGFSIGETQYANTPIAVCGRVLAYTYEHRDLFKPGEAVCSGPNGTVSRMTREEIRNWPDAIVGYVSEIPVYKYWGSDNIEVNGRVWIKVK